jgi:hypothetical protein
MLKGIDRAITADLLMVLMSALLHWPSAGSGRLG